jgi:hypothetical protein
MDGNLQVTIGVSIVITLGWRLSDLLFHDLPTESLLDGSEWL